LSRGDVERDILDGADGSPDDAPIGLPNASE
jgi:hypothetical protein